MVERAVSPPVLSGFKQRTKWCGGKIKTQSCDECLCRKRYHCITTRGVDPLGLLPYNVYNLVPSWADNCVILWTWGWDALCAAGRRSRVSVICYSVRSSVCA